MGVLRVSDGSDGRLNFDEKLIVDVRGLTKVYNGRVKAVDNISFGVREGEIFGFLGPNGAGKSTTIKILTTLLRPTSGTALVVGHDIIRQPNEVRRSVGVVHQEYTADEDLTGYENIILIADLYGIPREVSKKRAAELLKLVDLESAAGRKVSTYSGGMRRRLELACGLINNPRLLFLDEPTLGLDVQTRAAVWGYIRKLKEELDMTIFMTTHYLEEADSLCDRIAIIDRGKIVRVGSPEELKASIGGDVIEVEVDGSTGEDLTSVIAGVGNVSEVKRSGSTGYRIKAKMGEEVAPLVIELLRSRGYRVKRISLTKPSLDEVYLEYTGRSLREEEADRDQLFAQRATLRRARG
jgi:ABC-2 type transport system ATP-binding protein